MEQQPSFPLRYVEEVYFNNFLEESAENSLHYNVIKPFMKHQQTKYTCGFMTASVLVNAHKCQEVTSDLSLYDETCKKGLVDPEYVSKEGMTLDTLVPVLSDIMKTHIGEGKFELKAYFASDIIEDEANTIILDAFSDDRKRVIMNYHMETAGQLLKIGHFSPIVGSHTAADLILMMDVGQHINSGPVWIKWDVVWAAMQMTDAQTQKSRGFVVLTFRQ